MKNVVIIEDETLAVKHLSKLLHDIDPNLEIVAVLQTIEESVKYFEDNSDIDMVFMDIHLSDGLAFHIFEKVEVPYPIIFTTAYDKYALKAFKVNSIDYLMKPIKRVDLERGLEKMEKLSKGAKRDDHSTMEGILAIVRDMGAKYKENYLIPHGDKLLPLAVKEIACFYIETKVTHALTFDNKVHALDQSLDDIMRNLDPKKFYRANRQYILNTEAVVAINPWMGGKLQVMLRVNVPSQIIIPKAKTGEFKDWYTK